jgi:adenylate cyclase
MKEKLQFVLRRLGRLGRTSITAGILLVVIALFATETTVLDQFELRTYDLRFVSRGPLPTANAVVLAMIDEKSLATEGRWPWPRTKFAALVDRLSEAGAKVIAFDVGFLEPDENSELRLLDELIGTVDKLGTTDPKLAAMLATRREHADNDRALADSLRRAKAAVVLGYFFHMRGDRTTSAATPDAIARDLEAIDRSKYPLVTARGGATAPGVIPEAAAPEGNLPVLADAARSSGYFSVKQDSDGVVRWMPLVIAAGEEFFPPLSMLAAWHYLDEPRLMVKTGPYGIEGILLGDHVVPTDESGRLLIDYLGPPRTFPHVSIGDVLAGVIPSETFRDKIILVGAAATGIYDTRTTPFSTVHPGVEIHASVIDNLVSNRFISRPTWSELYDVLAIIVLGTLAAFCTARLGALPALACVTLLFAGHVFIARQLFVESGIWLNVVYPLLALVAVYMAVTVYQFVGEQRERRRIRDAFGRYVSPVVVEEMLKDPSRLELGGEEKILTVLFSDLQGFTSYSERYAPREMIELLSEYYARMTERVFACEGTLKEYVGDELMAIFGAPVEQPDHARRACRAALEMKTHREAMSREWADRGRPPLHARTGVNSGIMLVGNIGSRYRFSYGVLGDNVNLGSRLEGLNKEYGTEILVGENSVALLGDEFRLREVDMVRVVGKLKTVRIYELLGLAESVPENGADLSAFADYAAALEAYRTQHWAAASDLFEAVIGKRGGDGPSATMLKRCRAFLATPPAEDWDGVYEATRK